MAGWNLNTCRILANVWMCWKIWVSFGDRSTLLLLEVQALRHPMAGGGDYNDEAWCTC